MGIWDIIKRNEKKQGVNEEDQAVDENKLSVNENAREGVKKWKEILEQDGGTDNVKEAEKYFDSVSECCDREVLKKLAEIYLDPVGVCLIHKICSLVCILA